jgi:hypothetical protein
MYLILCVLYFNLDDEGDNMFLRSVSDFQRTTRRHIQEYRTVHNDSWENLKSYTRVFVFMKTSLQFTASGSRNFSNDWI